MTGAAGRAVPQMRPTMLYDGACDFCTRTMELAVARLPDRVTWVPYQSADLSAYGLSEAEVTRSVHLVDPSGRVEHGSAAVARVLVHSGGAWAVIGRLLLVPPVSLVAEAVYWLVGRFRSAEARS